MRHNAPVFTLRPLAPSPQLATLLANCGLPVSDISAGETSLFVGAFVGKDLAGTVGLQLYPPAALLRSLAVSPSHRGHGVGVTLVRHAEALAAERGVDTLYLLTTSAAPFFAKGGYEVVPRSAAPQAIQTTTQFSGLCPATSTCMAKRLNA